MVRFALTIIGRYMLPMIGRYIPPMLGKVARPPSPATGQATWRTALACNGGECIRVASKGNRILIGDSKNPDGPVLSYSRAEWRTFVGGIHQGDFDGL